jgi:hypothetical protein
VAARGAGGAKGREQEAKKEARQEQGVDRRELQRLDGDRFSS